MAALVARAIRARELSMLDVWFASLGPGRVRAPRGRGAGARSGARRRRRRSAKKKEPKIIEGYELVKPLGEGGIGSVWLVRKPGADRFFVLKIPKADALANATDAEREGILASFVEEAQGARRPLPPERRQHHRSRRLAGRCPFLVLEYLIGADLKQYSAARLMTLFELRQVVLEACAGLAALHGAGLVHRDIKPANLWLRLPLAGGERFDPDEAPRSGARARRSRRWSSTSAWCARSASRPRSAAASSPAPPGYIAPEQVLDPVELDPRSDVYALAGTIYNVTTGRAFFDEIENPRDRIIAHMRRDPFEDPERLRGFSSPIAKLLRAAGALAADRSSITDRVRTRIRGSALTAQQTKSASRRAANRRENHERKNSASNASLLTADRIIAARRTLATSGNACNMS